MSGQDPGPAARADVLIRQAWPLLRMLLGVVILVALGTRLGTGAFVDGLRAIDAGSVLAALGVGLLTTVSSAWRWCLVARGLGLRLPLPTAVADCYQAVFLNSVLPAGVLGDVHRAVSHGRRVGDLGRGVRAVAFERLAGLAVLLVVGVVVLFAHPAVLAAVVDGLVRGWAVMAGVLAVVVALVAWTVRGSRASTVRAVLRKGLADARAGVLARDIWPGVLLASVAALAGHVALFVVAARAAGSEAALGELLPLLLLALLAMGLPLGLGGWGPREAVAAVAFGAAGLGAMHGLTVAVVYGALSLLACLPGAGVLLLRHTGNDGASSPVRSSRVAPGLPPRATTVAAC